MKNLLSLLPCFLLVSAQSSAPAPQASRPGGPLGFRELAVPGKASRARVWSEPGADGRLRTFASVSLDGVHFGAARETHPELELRYERFDPLTGTAQVPSALRARPESRLFVVQYWTQGLEDYRDVLRGLGGEVLLFLENDANVIALERSRIEAVRALPFVRAVTPYHPAFKLEEELLAALHEGQSGPIQLNLLTMHDGAQDEVGAWVEAHGGAVVEVSRETQFMTLRLALEALPDLAALDEVQWIDRWGPRQDDMNIAREFHGANHVESLFGLTGTGVRVEVLDSGCDTSHPDLQPFLVHNNNSAGDHGTCTSGIITGDGLGNANARGAAPDAFLVVADYQFAYAGGSRFAHTGQLVDPALPYQCVLQSNSWSTLPYTTQYNSTSQNLDRIAFAHARISILHAQSNNGTRSCSGESWAKNIISVGALFHENTLTATDDNWSSGASIGPAADGRVKPDLASFYDRVLCTDQVGTAGYVNGNYFSNFSGTSAATPIVGGHLALVYQMWHLGLFGNAHPGATPFENAPYNTTAKALLINSATQWSFSGLADDRTRMHQGWGHPDLQRLSDELARIFVVDEADVLANLQSKSYSLEVLPGEANLRATMVYRDFQGTTSSTLHRINDLDLTLTSPSLIVYHGNSGLMTSMTSSPGGAADTVNTVENVILTAPESGMWTVTVTASELNADSHVETPEVDADFALVVSGAAEPPPTPPAAPTHLRGRAAPREAHLSFDDNSYNEDGFELERSPDGVTFAPLITLGAGDVDHVDGGLTPNTVYFYRVRATNGVGPSAWSNVLSVRTQKFAAR